MSALLLWNLAAMASLVALLGAKVWMHLWQDANQRSIFALVAVLVFLPLLGLLRRFSVLDETNIDPYLITFYAVLTSAALYRFAVHVGEYKLRPETVKPIVYCADHADAPKAARKATNKIDHTKHEHYEVDPNKAVKMWIGLVTLLGEIETADPCDNPSCKNFRARLKVEAEALREAAQKATPEQPTLF